MGQREEKRRHLVNQETINTKIEKKQLSWYGHRSRRDLSGSHY